MPTIALVAIHSLAQGWIGNGIAIGLIPLERLDCLGRGPAASASSFLASAIAPAFAAGPEFWLPMGTGFLAGSLVMGLSIALWLQLTRQSRRQMRQLCAHAPASHWGLLTLGLGGLKQLAAGVNRLSPAPRSQGQMSEVLDNAFGSLVQLRLYADNTWAYEFWSAGAKSVFGYSATALLAEPGLWRSRVCPEDLPIVTQVAEQLRQTGSAYKEYRFRDPDDSIRWIASWAKARWDDQARYWRVTITDVDISDLKRLEADLETSQMQVTDILNNTLACIVRYHIDPTAGVWHYDFWSAGAEVVFGFTAEEFMADDQLWASRIPPEDFELQIRPTWDDICHERPYKTEYRFRHKDGSLRWIASAGMSRWDQTDQCWVVTVIDTDISDRKAAEEDLRRYERVIATTQDAVALVNRDYVYQIANPAYLERFGLTLEGCIGRTVLEIVGSAIFDRVLPYLERCLTGETVQFELWYDYPAAGRQYISATYSPYWALNGTVEGVVASFRALTELKLAEEALRDSESRFRALAANLPGILYRYVRYADGSDRFTYISPGIRVLYGLEPETAMANAAVLWQAVHPDDLDDLVRSMELSAQTLDAWQWEGRILHASGQIKWIQGRAQPQPRADGSMIWDGLLIDISQRKRYEAERQQAEDLLQAERNLLAEVMNTSVAAIAVLNPQGQFIYANDYTEQILGFSKADLYRRCYNAPDWQATTIDGEALSQASHPFRRVLTTGKPVYDIRYAIEKPGGERRILSVNGAPVKTPQGEIARLVFTLSDITDQLVADNALRLSQERYRLVAENMSDLVCLHRPDGTYLYVTPSCRSLLGYEPEDLIGHNLSEFFHPEDGDSVAQNLQLMNNADIVMPMTYRLRHRDGHYVWLETLSKAIVDDQGQVVQLQTTSRNVSEKVEIQQRLEHDAIHDSLTGLPNRSLLMERLDLAIERYHRHPEFGFAVLFLDLDRFKVINDSLGHPVGDDLLVAMAQLLSRELRAIDLAARLGGDEFVLLLEDLTDIHEVAQVAQRILTALQQPFILGHREVFINTSIGIALGADHYQMGTEILRDADIAMYRAKQAGKARYAIFDPAMHEQVLHAMYLENALRKAIDNGEFCIHYQPIISLRSGRLQGFEGLVRWQHLSQGLISPGQFIPIAEETGLIVALGEWIMRQACGQLKQWQQQFCSARSLSVNVNLSARQLKDPQFIDILDSILEETGLSPSSLQLEVTESVLIEDVDRILANLSAIRARGIRLSIDDFGTGYSSLSYLHRFPFTCIKIDRAFVNGLPVNPESASIVTSILALADSLNLAVVAEGVETPQEVSCLRQLNCELAQGFYFSQPLSPDQVEQLLEQEQPGYVLEHLEPQR